jgi:hypothetical protein
MKHCIVLIRFYYYYIKQITVIENRANIWICVFINLLIKYGYLCILQNHQFQQPIVHDFTAFSPMKLSAMFSGTAGTVKLQDTSAHLDSLMTARHVSACGPIKFQNAKMKVRYLLDMIFKIFFLN